MGRSLFAKLHRRFGRRISGEEHRRRAEVHYERVRESLPIGMVGGGMYRVAAAAPHLVVIGAGFAGTFAAWLAKDAGFAVTLIEPGVVGGRVSSTETLVPGRILEAGAELIGTNHPLWVMLARRFNFALSLLTSEENYAAAGLHMPFILDGRRLTTDEQQKLHDEIDEVFQLWGAKSKIVDNAWTPWETPGAADMDALSLASQIPSGVSELAKKAILLEFELDNCLPATEQSWLGNLAQLRAGGGYEFFEETEVFRCSAGNQALATRLAAGMNLNRGSVKNIRTGSRLYVDMDVGPEGPFDFAIVAVPGVAMEKITIDGAPFPLKTIAHGPAVKYLSGIQERFWLNEELAPSGVSDRLGMMWEGTDNQMDTARFDVSVFAGGRPAQAAIDGGGGAAYFAPRLTEMLPGYRAIAAEFENWPHRQHIEMGYSCPARGEVTTKQKRFVELIAGRIAVAGEHTSPPWFGFMEGALQTGLQAVWRIAQAAGVPMRREYGNFRAV